MIVLTFDEPTPSINVSYGHHWSKKHALKARWRMLVTAARLAAKIYDKPRYPKAKVTIERYGPKVLDADNARAGMKILMDQLVQQGLLLDDNPNVIGEPIVRQIVSRTERKTIVTVEPA